MPVITSKLSNDQQKKLLSLFGHVRLHLLYKASIHGFTAAAFHARCDIQGPSVVVALNAAGFVFGAYTSVDYRQNNQNVNDAASFLYSISAGRKTPLKVTGLSGQHAFINRDTGPNFGALCTGFSFQAAEMHGENLVLTELEVWRNIQWTAERKQQQMMTIQNYKSVIKTVNQAPFRGNMTCQAITGTSGNSVTIQHRTYTIKAGKQGAAIPLVLCDTMGLEENDDTGLNIDDLFKIFKSHIKDRYQLPFINPGRCSGYKRSLQKIHCIAYVVDACKVSLLSDNMVKKFQAIRQKANQMGIPQVLLMTKVDEACQLVANDLRNVYNSVYIQKKARQLSESLRIPLSFTLPVKNYSKELELHQDMDILLFMALEQMLNYAGNFFENQIPDCQDDGDDLELYRSNDHARRVSSVRSAQEVV
uniref:Interferon induced protein 44c1 n=1 Tax=Nothobranchius furzeri TaxID=105023 RepID=A0A8C6Q900_NOTFU